MRASAAVNVKTVQTSESILSQVYLNARQQQLTQQSPLLGASCFGAAKESQKKKEKQAAMLIGMESTGETNEELTCAPKHVDVDPSRDHVG